MIVQRLRHVDVVGHVDQDVLGAHGNHDVPEDEAAAGPKHARDAPEQAVLFVGSEMVDGECGVDDIERSRRQCVLQRAVVELGVRESLADSA